MDRLTGRRLRCSRTAQLALLSGLTLWADYAQAQFASPGASAAPSRARPLPLSGRGSEPGAVSTVETTSGGGIETLSSSVKVDGSLQGSVPSSTAPAGVIALTLAEAVRLGLEANLGTLTADNTVRASRAARRQALSTLLPNLAANAIDTVTQLNLAAFGFKFNVPPGLNFSIPTVVGPFNYSQAQATLNQSIYDPVQRRNWQASKETERASMLAARDTRELVVLAVAG